MDISWGVFVVISDFGNFSEAKFDIDIFKPFGVKILFCVVLASI